VVPAKTEGIVVKTVSISNHVQMSETRTQLANVMSLLYTQRFEHLRKYEMIPSRYGGG